MICLFPVSHSLIYFSRQDSDTADCSPAYQRATVHVSARFHLSESHLLGSYTTLIDLTELLISRLRVRDVTVANIENNVLSAVSVGVTQVEVSVLIVLSYYRYYCHSVIWYIVSC